MASISDRNVVERNDRWKIRRVHVYWSFVLRSLCLLTFYVVRGIGFRAIANLRCLQRNRSSFSHFCPRLCRWMMEMAIGVAISIVSRFCSDFVVRFFLHLDWDCKVRTISNVSFQRMCLPKVSRICRRYICTLILGCRKNAFLLQTRLLQRNSSVPRGTWSHL